MKLSGEAEDRRVPTGARWRVELFGGILLRSPEGVTAVFKRQKSALLLARLITGQPGKAWSRADLVGCFWITDTEKNRNSLTKCVSELRGILGTDIFCADHKSVMLTPDSIASDLADVSEWLRRAESTTDTQSRLEFLENAVRFCATPLLSNHEDIPNATEWIEPLRHEWEPRFYAARHNLLAIYEAVGKPRHALAIALQLLSDFPSDKDAGSAVMRLQAHLGDNGIGRVLQMPKAAQSLPEVVAHLRRVREREHDILPAETQTFQAAFDAAWESLIPGTQRQLALLAATHGANVPVTASSAATVWEITKTEAFTVLHSFADSGFVYRYEDDPSHPFGTERRERFHILPDTHALLAERATASLSPTKIRTAQTNLRDWATALTEWRTYHSLARIRAVEAETLLAVLKSAWERSHHTGSEPEIASVYAQAMNYFLRHDAERERFVAETQCLYPHRHRFDVGTRFMILYALYDYLPISEQRDHVLIELLALRTQVDFHGHYYLLYEAALHAHHAENDVEAREYADAAFDLIRSVSAEERPCTRAFVPLADIYFVQGLPDRANDLYEWAQEHLLPSASNNGRAFFLCSHADFLRYRGEFARAGKQFETVFDLIPEEDGYRSIILRDLAALYIWSGREKEATVFLREAQSRYRQEGKNRDSPCQSAVIGLLGDIDLRGGNTTAAREKYSHAIQVWERERHDRWQAIFCLRLAACAFYDGDNVTMTSLLNRARKHITTRSPLLHTRWLYWHGRLLTKQHDSTAVVVLDNALTEMRRLELRPYAADCLDALADAHNALGDTGTASLYRAESDAEREAMGYPRPTIEA